MELVTPEIGLVFWTTLSFLILLFLLAKFAWKPILKAVKDREYSIESALLKADALKAEMARITSENEDLLKQARAERDAILQEARKVKNQMIADAKGSAQEEANKLMDQARIEINSQKAIALATIKDQVGQLSLEIAEKILRKQFEDAKKQDDLVAELLKEVKL